jgi:hypothetical protein
LGSTIPGTHPGILLAFNCSACVKQIEDYDFDTPKEKR